jgi:hypothetical protein
MRKIGYLMLAFILTLPIAAAIAWPAFLDGRLPRWWRDTGTVDAIDHHRRPRHAGGRVLRCAGMAAQPVHVVLPGGVSASSRHAPLHSNCAPGIGGQMTARFALEIAVKTAAVSPAATVYRFGETLQLLSPSVKATYSHPVKVESCP